jgi:hypothetical protein
MKKLDEQTEDYLTDLSLQRNPVKLTSLPSANPSDHPAEGLPSCKWIAELFICKLIAKCQQPAD